MSRLDKIHTRLTALQPTQIELVDDSHKHAGHTGTRNGGGHYRLLIVPAQFANKPTVARHRMVYSALGDMMKNEIHALHITACAPDKM